MPASGSLRGAESGAVPMSEASRGRSPAIRPSPISIRPDVRREHAQISLAIVALALTGAAAAQDLPPEGDFTINFTAIGVNPAPTFSIGPEREWGVFDAVMTATNAEGSGLLHNLTGRCASWFVIDTGPGTFEQHGHCNYTDADGDAIWEKFDFDPQPLGPVRIAAGRWIGGSGKYDGIRGEFEIRVRPLRPGREDVAQAIGTKQGSYRIAPSQ